MLDISIFFHWSIKLFMASKGSTMLLIRLYGVYYTTSDLASAYNQVPLLEENQKTTSSICWWKTIDVWTRILRSVRCSKLLQSKNDNPLCWNHCSETSHLKHWCLSARKNRKRFMEKIGSFFPIFEIIRVESCTKQNQTLFKKNSIPWTPCFRQRKSTSGRQGPWPEKFEEP